MGIIELLIFLAALPLVIALQVYLLIQKMSKPETMIKPLAGLSPDKQAWLLEHQGWLTLQQLEWLTAFQFGAIEVAVFKQRNAPRFFCFYFNRQKATIDIETEFGETRSLTTATSDAIGMFPQRPGTFKQGFPGLSAEEAWQKHLAAEEYLAKRHGLTPTPLDRPFQEIVLENLRLQMQYVRSIPFYPFRALYWYWAGRKRMAYRSIQEQGY